MNSAHDPTKNRKIANTNRIALKPHARISSSIAPSVASESVLRPRRIGAGIGVGSVEVAAMAVVVSGGR
jgi:hypothetical protein